MASLRVPPRNSRSLLACGGLLFCSTLSCFGLGTRIVDQNADATSRGDAFTATADNASAIYYNPAGITQLAGTELLLGGYGVSFTSRVKLQEKNDPFYNQNNPQGIPQIYATTKLPNVPITLGLGIYSPFGFSIRYPDSVPFRTFVKSGSIEYLAISPVIGIQITKSLAVGFGPTINYGQASLSRGVFERGDDFHFRGDDWSLGATVGVRWQPHPMHSFGVTYYSPTNFDFDGDTHLHYQTVKADIPIGGGATQRIVVVPGFDQRQKATASFHFPQHVTFGYSFRPTPDWNFEADVDWTDWDSLNTVTLEQRSGNQPLPFNWESSFIYEFGITRKWHDWRFSLGYVYSENSVPNESFNPIVPDGNHHIFSGGVGRKFGPMTVDVGYQYTFGGPRTVEQNTAVDGDYRFSAHAVTFSLGYHF